MNNQEKRNLAEVEGLEFIETTSERNGYPSNLQGAIIGFESFKQAEEIAEKLPSVTDQIIHEHEEMAEKLAIVLYALGLVSLIGL